MTSIRFHDPLLLLTIVPVIAIAAVSIRRRRRSAVLYSSVELVRKLPVTLALRIKRFLPWLQTLGMVLVALALARPQYGSEEFRVRTEGVAIQLCVDRSGSMRALDFEIDGERADRLEVTKQVLEEFVESRPDDMIGLVPFGGYAESKCPLTLDHGALLQVLDTVKIPEAIRDSRGRVINEELLQEDLSTAVGDALALATGRLKDIDAKSKIIVLLTDGESNAGEVDPEEAADAAREFGVKVYTVGVGSTGRVPVRAVDPLGREVLVAQEVRLDEETLKMIADRTGGKYFNARDSETLEKVYAEIDRLEKTVTEGRLYTEYGEMFQYLMFPGIACIVLTVALTTTRFRSLP